MEISWVLSEDYNDPIVKSEQLKNIGSTWGSWKTWRSWSTDNVLCADNTKAQDLIKRAFHSVCNFYIPQKSYIILNRPTGVKVFEGDFPDDFTKQEDVIAMHLCSQSELVLCMGFNLQEITDTDPKAKFLAKSYETAIRAVIKNNPNTQFVFIDHPGELDKSLKDLENISCDTFENVLQLLT
tara:strand:- start:16 stop:561 length:546 start_codon:yes stop_codon:yes gene_type:complete